MMQYLYNGFDSPISYKPEDRSKAAAAYNRAQFDRLLDALETRLEGRDHLWETSRWWTLRRRAGCCSESNLTCPSMAIRGSRHGASAVPSDRLSAAHASVMS